MGALLSFSLVSCRPLGKQEEEKCKTTQRHKAVLKKGAAEDGRKGTKRGRKKGQRERSQKEERKDVEGTSK